MATARGRDPQLEKAPLFDWLPGPSARTLSLPEQIAEKVGNAIIRGVFEPGHRIQEQDLADRFQVSRGPVREALRILERDGMVQILPRRGAQVTRLDIDEVIDIFEIRASLFGLAARLIATRPETEAVREIKAGAERLQLLAHSGQADEYVSAVYQLNMKVAEASGNRHLRGMMFSLAHQTLRYSRLGLSTEKRRLTSAKSWKRLASALVQRDAPAAQRIAEQLVTASRDMAVQLLRKAEAARPKNAAA